MTTTKTKKLAIGSEDVATREFNGCQSHLLISPATVGSTQMIVGTTTVPVGVKVLRVVHPHSEKCFYILRGEGKIVFDDDEVTFRGGQALLIPQGTPYSVYNLGNEEMQLLSVCAPLAPSPKEGHIILEREDDHD